MIAAWFIAAVIVAVFVWLWLDVPDENDLAGRVDF